MKLSILSTTAQENALTGKLPPRFSKLNVLHLLDFPPLNIRLPVNVYFISNNVGQGLAPAVEINENKTAFGCYQIEFNIIP